MKEHNYLYQAPDEQVPFARHKRRPGNQARLRGNPRTRNSEVTGNCISIMPDGTKRVLVRSGRVVAPKQLQRDYTRAQEVALEVAERKARMAAIVSGNYSDDHWSR